MRPTVTSTDGVAFTVKSFVLKGVTLLSEAEVQATLKPWLNREIRFADLENALQAIADLYTNKGWFARPQLPEQDLGDDGSLLIEVVEARFGQIRFEAQPPYVLNPDFVKGSLSARQRPGAPLSVQEINRAVGLLNELPGVRLATALSTGTEPGSADVVVTSERLGLGMATLSADNTGSRATGAYRASLSAAIDNPGRFALPYGLGDQFALNLMASEGVRYGRLAYSLPVGFHGLRLGVNGSQMSYVIVNSLQAIAPSGDSRTLGLTATYPLRRSPSGATNLVVSYDDRHFNNESAGRVFSVKQINNLSVSVSGDRSDLWAGGGVILGGVTLVAGRLDLSGQSDNQTMDRSTARTEGDFQKLSATVSRLQRLNEKNSLWFSLNAQRAGRNLDSSEKFSLGGSQGVRAYPGAEATGDHGWQFSAEHRYVLTSNWQLIGFYDHGAIWLNDRSFSGAPALNQYALRGWGGSVAYSLPGKASARLTLARRIGENPVPLLGTQFDSDGTLERVRVWLSAVVYF